MDLPSCSCFPGLWFHSASTDRCASWSLRTMRRDAQRKLEGPRTLYQAIQRGTGVLSTLWATALCLKVPLASARRGDDSRSCGGDALTFLCCVPGASTIGQAHRLAAAGGLRTRLQRSGPNGCWDSGCRGPAGLGDKLALLARDKLASLESGVPRRSSSAEKVAAVRLCP